MTQVTQSSIYGYSSPIQQCSITGETSLSGEWEVLKIGIIKTIYFMEQGAEEDIWTEEG
jgi:hypothetical protein